MHPAIELTMNLIGIKSLSGKESEVMNFITKWADNAGFTVYEHNEGDLFNRILVTGKGPRTLIFTTHLDTVVPDPASWKVTTPYEPKIVDDRLYGLGANDATGIAATMMTAAYALSKTELMDIGRMMIVLVSAEETSGEGSNQTVQYMLDHPNIFELDLAQTIVIAGEPSSIADITYANKVNAFVTFTIEGVSSHGSQPHLGKNAAIHAPPRS